MRRLLLAGPLLLLTLVFGPRVSAAQPARVIISEIMYHPPSTNVLEEWVELLNAGGSPADLTGWQFSHGIQFTFPAQTLLPAGARLVIAADAATFHDRHPAVTGFLAGWTGSLRDNGERLTLTDALGQVVNEVSYAPEGDWAIRRMGPPDSHGRTGWEWYAEHDGLGKSLELINPSLPNEYGHNWSASRVEGGTPGQPNSSDASDIAPLVIDVGHFPLIPGPSDPVTIHVRLVDEQKSGLSVTLFHRVDGAASFTSVALLDDGAHGDGLAGDGLFAVRLPPHPEGTLVEFYVVATDATGHARTYPAVAPTDTGRTANLVYQVDSEVFSGIQPLYRILLPKAEYDYLKKTWSDQPDSDAEVNGTFIGVDGQVREGAAAQVRYLSSFRNRGHGTRVSVPHNFRVNFPKDRLWQGREGINLNTQFTPAQVLGSMIMRRARLPMAESRAVRVRVNGEDLAGAGSPQFGSYAANELVDDSLVERQFPGDPNGNLYRGIRDVFPGNPKADLAWHGPDFSSYTNAYFKRNHTTENDWRDLVRLVDVLNNAPDATYPDAVRQVADVEEWMRYFALNTLMGNQETALATGYGDDFALYAGVADPRVRLLAYDMDSVLGSGTRNTTYADGLFRMFGSGNHRIPTLERLLKHPEFAPIYYRELRSLADTVFAPERMNPVLDQLAGGFDPSAPLDTAIENFRAFNSSQREYVLGEIPGGISVTDSLPTQSGYPRTTTSAIALQGRADAVKTRTIQVNGLPATWSAWEASWNITGVPVHPGLNQIRIESLDGDGRVFESAVHDVWYDDGTVSSAGTTIAGNTTWSAADGPFQITGNLTVASGATLTLTPGTTVYLGPGANLTVASGGRILAEGTAEAPIRFTRSPGSASAWGGIVLNGGGSSPENRITHAHIEFNGTTAIEVAGAAVFLDSLTFGTTDHQYLALDGASFVVGHCIFPSSTAAFELVHGTQGIRPGGHGIIHHCFFGTTSGYNDIVDFTGGNRASQPIVHFINNVFTGATDDILDLDNTDAWIEGNIFLHSHKNGSPDSSSAISGGNDTGQPSEITIIGNLFYDCDHAVTGKESNFYVLLNNTVVHQTHAGGLDTDGAVVNLADEGKLEGAGMYLEGNIIQDAEKLVRNLTTATVTFRNNITPLPWSGPGGDNVDLDPLLNHLPTLEETQFKTWEEAQVLRNWFALQPGSPATGTGPVGQDRGGVLPLGVFVSGAPVGTTRATGAVLSVGPNRSGQGIPASGWPQGAGYTHYRWRLDGGAWSVETPIAESLILANLTPGNHRVDVTGRRDSGLYQDDPLFGDDAAVSTTAEWTVDPNFVPPAGPTVRINEVLARNTTSFTSGETTPDLIELVNSGQAAVDLGGYGLSDDASLPYRYRLPDGIRLDPGTYLVLLADSDTASPGLHTGFALKQEGDSVFLTAPASAGGQRVDSVTFGLQVADVSLGRRADGSWGLCRPTFGAPNHAVSTGSPKTLRINEWLANARFLYADDFVELYNPDSRPVSLAGLYLTDAAGMQDRYVFPPLSFIAAESCLSLRADGDDLGRPGHLPFKLAAESGILQLSDPELTPIDTINYGPQQTDVSEGRTPSGADRFALFREPTPGAPNPGSGGGGSTNVTYVSTPLIGFGTQWKYLAGLTEAPSAWTTPEFADGSWSSGAAPLGLETSTPYPYPIRIATPLPITAPNGTHIKTYYFRTHFQAPAPGAGWTLHATNYLDDGAVYYLNGFRIGALRVTDNPARYTSDATLQPDEGQAEVLSLPATHLREGDNVLAVEVHQSGSSSSDVMFAMALGALESITNTTSGSAPVVVLNEVFARNQTRALPDGNLAGWVELYNPGTNDVVLTGLALSDDAATPRKWEFPDGPVLPPKGFRTIRFDATQPASGTNTGFGLSARGGSVFLSDRSSAGGAVLDALHYGLQAADFGVGRVPDGGGDWELTVPAPDTANLRAGLGSPTSLRLNEWMADPAVGSDWFEIFNPDAAPVALHGLAVTDDLADIAKSPFPPLSFIGTGRDGYLQVFADKKPAAGGNHADFKLSKDGSTLGLFARSGLTLDALGFGAQGHGISEGRLPDGADILASFPVTPTPEAPNRIGGLPGDSDSDGMPDDWETAHGLDPRTDDSGLDPDQDGFSNLDEFLAGTDPKNAASSLAVEAFASDNGTVSIRFQAVAGRTYTVQRRKSLTAEEWTLAQQVPARESNGTVTLPAGTLSDGDRYFRILTPAIP
ncbi:MAG: lamin tail domain-containing protein [Verrucomicrobiota bacterium]